MVVDTENSGLKQLVIVSFESEISVCSVVVKVKETGEENATSPFCSPVDVIVVLGGDVSERKHCSFHYHGMSKGSLMRQHLPEVTDTVFDGLAF